MPPTELPTPSRPLLFLDYDGTLAPIVDDPMEAHPHPAVPELLAELDARVPVWIVTGRDVDALDHFLDRPLKVIGLHGAQKGRVGGEVEHLMSDAAARAIGTLRESVPDVDGVEVEEKDRAFAVHYRQARSKDEAKDRLQAWLDATPEIVDAIWGKDVVELRAKGLTKGTAVRRIAADHPDRTPVYLGDDVTDEDAFEALHALRDEEDREVVTVKVGDGDTAATYRLDGPDAVVDYLRRFV
jgi:trehalose 6-phosphate phosphatase